MRVFFIALLKRGVFMNFTEGKLTDYERIMKEKPGFNRRPVGMTGIESTVKTISLSPSPQIYGNKDNGTSIRDLLAEKEKQSLKI